MLLCGKLFLKVIDQVSRSGMWIEVVDVENDNDKKYMYKSTYTSTFSKKSIHALMMLVFLLSSQIFISCQEAALERRSDLSSVIKTDDGGSTIGDGSGDGTESTDGPTRPTGQITFDNGFCACQDSKSTILNDCAAFCSDKPDSQEYLYVDFLLGTEITSSSFQNVQGWCTNALENDTSVAGCVMKFYGDNGHYAEISTISFTDNDSIKVGLESQLQEGITYVFHLEEISSGATTNSVQLQKGTYEVDPPFLGPLKIQPVHQYTCMSLGISTDANSGNVYIQTAFPLHYYYIESNTPPTIPPGINNIYCHDIQQFPEIDSPVYPRLQLVNNQFAIWNETDPRFYDLDSNGIMDIHDKIRDEVAVDGVIYDPATQKLFLEFSWPNYPYNAVPTAPGAGNSAAKLGFIMTPWIDQQSFKSYCPEDVHYNSSNKIFNALKKYIGEEMEGIYLAVKEAETTSDETGAVVLAANDYLLLRESMLKEIWFYIDNEQKIEPTNENVGSKTVHFYWPPKPLSPFIKDSSQKLYTVRHPSDLSESPASDNTDLQTSLRPHDKRFGCVPKLDFN
jgi:hypothetical protein